MIQLETLWLLSQRASPARSLHQACGLKTAIELVCTAFIPVFAVLFTSVICPAYGYALERLELAASKRAPSQTPKFFLIILRKSDSLTQ